MSLLDTFSVCGGVLQAQDVYLAVRSDAPANGGTGVWDDPFYAAGPGLSDTANAALFDGIMSNSSKVSPGTTVRLGPGTFCTAGSESNGTGAWHPTNGRLVGAGMGVTTLKLVGVPASKVRYAIGMSLTSGGLDGFSASDFTVNCNYDGNTQTDSGSCGIAVQGKNILLERIRVTNFGYRVPSVPVPVVVGAAANSLRCILEDCVVEGPGSGNPGYMSLFAFTGTKTAPHYHCVIRNCAARVIDSFENPIPSLAANQYTAIDPGAGVGVILEGNQIANCFWGVNSQIAARDLIVRNNYFRNVNRGIALYVSSPDITDRVALLGNIIELSTSVLNPIPTGIELGGDVGGDRFKDVTIRRNFVRDVNEPVGLTNGILGLQISAYRNALVDSNIINNCGSPSAFYYNGPDTLSTFNNQDSSGNAFRPWNPSALKFKDDLNFKADFGLLGLAGRRSV